MQVVDGTNMVFGRLASQVAKRLMQGEEVHLINAEKLVIVGNPKQVSARYLTKRGIKHKGTPERSPVWPRIPHMLVKRMIRGMLPRESSRGRDALKRLRVYTGNPKKLEGSLKLEKAGFDGVSKHITIHELCKSIGFPG
ncbi:MAG: 50S ribosomal protein L13 [Candidatus Micrarchaeota archaeon]